MFDVRRESQSGLFETKKTEVEEVLRHTSLVNFKVSSSAADTPSTYTIQNVPIEQMVECDKTT